MPAFHLIPVMDLMGGQVVAAVGGLRSSYQPLQSPLCSDANPQSLLSSYLKRGFQQIYVADLDAILQRGQHHALIGEALIQYPQLEIWLDAGISTWQSLNQARERICTHPALEQRLKLVVGTETFREAPVTSWPRDLMLSLDFGAEGYRGDPGWQEPAHWPDTVILMSLSQVGGQSGPDLERLKHFQNLAPNKTLVAAGGIRHLQDLKALEHAGVHRGLVATALHRGQF